MGALEVSRRQVQTSELGSLGWAGQPSGGGDPAPRLLPVALAQAALRPQCLQGPGRLLAPRIICILRIIRIVWRGERQGHSTDPRPAPDGCSAERCAVRAPSSPADASSLLLDVWFAASSEEHALTPPATTPSFLARCPPRKCPMLGTRETLWSRRHPQHAS